MHKVPIKQLWKQVDWRNACTDWDHQNLPKQEDTRHDERALPRMRGSWPIISTSFVMPPTDVGHGVNIMVFQSKGHNETTT